MNSHFLKNLFESLNKKNVKYLVLRGYQNLPDSFNHDIDLSVIDEKELSSFFNVIHNLKKKFNYKIVRDVVRVGLLKVQLIFDSDVVKIDVFCSFQYAGLIYINSYNLHSSERKTKSGISIPALNYELAISLLKEILHNSRIREDKVDLLRSQYDKITFEEPLKNCFSKNTIKKLSESLFDFEKLIFKQTSFIFRIELFFSNLKYLGTFNTFQKIFNFFYVKYFFQQKYDSIILNENSS